MGIALSGLASGFDWKSLVDQLIEVNRAPQKQMQADKSKNASKTSALNEIKSALATLKDTVANLGTKGDLLKKSASFSGSSTSWSSSVSTDAVSGKYTFNVLSLATASKLNGVAGIAAKADPNLPVSSLSIGRTVTAGNFTVNGTKVTIATTDSINDVLNSINSNVSGVTASYDVATDKITLSSTGGAIVLGAANDTSNFLQAMRLTSNASGTSVSASSLGCIKLTGPIDSANLASPVTSATSSSFKINGTEITYNTATDSLQALISRINASAAGVTASLDPSSGQMVLTSNQTGNIGIFVSDDTGGLANSLGMIGATLANGTDAEFKLNGGCILTSRSNTLDETAHGITGLNVTATSTGTETVTVAADTSSTKASVQKFIDDYNAVQNVIEKYTKVTTSGSKVSAAILAGNSSLSDIARSLRKKLYESSSGITGTIQRLSDIGVGFSGVENTISITNSSLLDSKLASSADDISAYLNTDTNGLIARMNSLLGSLLSDSSTSKGTLQAQLDTITSQNKSLDSQIADIDRRLTMQRSSLEASFQAMETAQSKYQQQSAYLSKTFANN